MALKALREFMVLAAFVALYSVTVLGQLGKPSDALASMSLDVLNITNLNEAKCETICDPPACENATCASFAATCVMDVCKCIARFVIYRSDTLLLDVTDLCGPGGYRPGSFWAIQGSMEIMKPVPLPAPIAPKTGEWKPPGITSVFPSFNQSLSKVHSGLFKAQTLLGALPEIQKLTKIPDLLPFGTENFVGVGFLGGALGREDSDADRGEDPDNEQDSVQEEAPKTMSQCRLYCRKTTDPSACLRKCVDVL